MSANIAWFEVVGADPVKLQGFYGKLFGWSFDPAPGEESYGLVPCEQSGVPGGVGEAKGSAGWSTFYVSVPDVPAALERATALGGSVLAPAVTLPDGATVAVFADPEGHPVGVVAAPA